MKKKKKKYPTFKWLLVSLCEEQHRFGGAFGSFQKSLAARVFPQMS